MDSIIVVGELCQIQLAFGSRGVYPGPPHPFHPAQPGIKPTPVDVLFLSSYPPLLSHNKPLRTPPTSTSFILSNGSPYRYHHLLHVRPHRQA
jgi:hypothetical protein